MKEEKKIQWKQKNYLVEEMYNRNKKEIIFKVICFEREIRVKIVLQKM